MTNATNPLLVLIKFLGGLVNTYIDQTSAIKVLSSTATSINGTNYVQLKKPDQTNYGSVPASTNLRLYGFESIVFTNGGGVATVIQFGYADDAAGTNFVSLFDIFAAFGSGAQTVNNIFAGLLTVPTGKFPLIKQTNNNTLETVTPKIIAFETN